MKLILKIAVLIFVAGAGFAGYKALKGTSEPSYETFTVIRSSVTQDVTLTGKTQSTQTVDLSFENSGKIKSINKDVGDKVSEEDIILILDSSEQTLELAEAQASLEVQLSALRELKKGTRPEEILVYETKLSNAKVDLTSSLGTLADKLRDAFTKSDDSIHNNVDQLFSNPRSSNPQINITVSDSQLKANIEQGRVSAEILLGTLRDISGSVSSQSSSVLLGQSSQVLLEVNTLKKFLDNVALAVNALTANSSLTQVTVDSYKSSVSSARTIVNTAVSAILTAEEKVRAALSSVSLSEKELSLKKAGATSEQLSSQEAKIRQSQAYVARLRLILGKMTMKSPISGVVTKQDAKIGGIVSAQVPLVSIISENSLQIEANIPEVDIGRIDVNDPVRITIDAFPGENFEGRVSYVDPAETIIDGVVNFKSKIEFTLLDVRFKSGLTANLEIQTLSKSNVLTIPQLAIVENDQGTFVKKLEGNTLRDVSVTLGVRDNSGNIEVVSGLKEGDVVINVGLKTK